MSKNRKTKIRQPCQTHFSRTWSIIDQCDWPGLSFCFTDGQWQGSSRSSLSPGRPSTPWVSISLAHSLLLLKLPVQRATSRGLSFSTVWGASNRVCKWATCFSSSLLLPSNGGGRGPSKGWALPTRTFLRQAVPDLACRWGGDGRSICLLFLALTSNPAFSVIRTTFWCWLCYFLNCFRPRVGGSTLFIVFSQNEPPTLIHKPRATLGTPQVIATSITQIYGTGGVACYLGQLCLPHCLGTEPGMRAECLRSISRSYGLTPHHSGNTRMVVVLQEKLPWGMVDLRPPVSPVNDSLFACGWTGQTDFSLGSCIYLHGLEFIHHQGP